MADDPFSVSPYYNAWLNFQAQMLKAQEPFWQQMSEAMPGPGDARYTAVESLWKQAQEQCRDWAAQIQTQTASGATGAGISQEVLQRMMDPGQFLYAGSDEVNKTIQQLVEGPEFSDIGALERRGLKATREWIALREASAAYRWVTGKAWTRAAERFSKEAMGDAELWKQGPTAILGRWLEIANDELIATQRTEEFLEAQRALLRTGVNYRLREREMVEQWCETHSIPTRGEVDDLHKTVYGLRHQVRALEKEVAALRQARRAPKKQDTER